MPSLPQAIEPRNCGHRLDRLAGPALPGRGSPHPSGTEEPQNLIFLVLGNHRTRFACLSPRHFAPAPDFTPIYTVFSSLAAAATHTPCSIIPHCHRSLSLGLSPPPGIKPPRDTNTFPPCSHSSQLLPGSATHLSSARRMLPARQTAAEVTDLQASTRLGMPPEMTSTAAGACKFNAVDTGHQLAFAHTSAACRMAMLERWQKK